MIYSTGDTKLARAGSTSNGASHPSTRGNAMITACLPEIDGCICGIDLPLDIPKVESGTADIGRRARHSTRTVIKMVSSFSSVVALRVGGATSLHV